MAKFDAAARPPRVLIYGDPASGKTGALAQLANAGYRLLIFDFDQNSRVIGSFLKPDAADIYVNTYAVAKMTGTNLFAGNKGDAAQAALKEMRHFVGMLQHWKTESEDLGPASSLTAKDVLVIDSGTFLGELLFMAAKADPEANKHTPTQYRIAGEYYSAILDYLCGSKVGASVVVLTHVTQTGDKDSEGKFIGKPKDIPVALGDKMSKRMPSYFSDIWRLEVDRTGQRRFRTAATAHEGLRTSNPSKIKAEEPFDLAAMFNRLLEP
jgi:hypothetical protein